MRLTSIGARSRSIAYWLFQPPNYFAAAAQNTADRRLSPPLLIDHESVEEVREFVVRIERKNIGDVLVRTHNHQGTLCAVDPAQDEDVRPVLDVGRMGLLIVYQPELALPRQQHWRKFFDLKVAVALLEDRPYVDDTVDVRASRRVTFNRRSISNEHL